MNSKLAENASLNKDLSISGLRAAYTNGELTPEELFSFIRSKS
ncbi:MAG: hypothetical protein ACI8VW_001283, partial [bacterium]